MTVNVGDKDRLLRAVIGGVLLLLALFGIVTGTVGWIAGVIGVVLLATAAFRSCPAYRLLGMNTDKP